MKPHYRLHVRLSKFSGYQWWRVQRERCYTAWCDTSRAAVEQAALGRYVLSL